MKIWHMFQYLNKTKQKKPHKIVRCNWMNNKNRFYLSFLGCPDSNITLLCFKTMTLDCYIQPSLSSPLPINCQSSLVQTTWKYTAGIKVTIELCQAADKEVQLFHWGRHRCRTMGLMLNACLCMWPNQKTIAAWLKKRWRWQNIVFLQIFTINC